MQKMFEGNRNQVTGLGHSQLIVQEDLKRMPVVVHIYATSHRVKVNCYSKIEREGCIQESGQDFFFFFFFWGKSPWSS